MRAPATRIAVVTTAAAVLAACATGDGRELRPPTEPPPTTTTTVPAAPTDELPGDELPGEVPAPGPDDVPLDPPPGFELFAAWQDGAEISERHTCDGADVSPALTWTGVPDGTVELAITVVDERDDANAHWIVTGIDPSSVSTLEGRIPPGAAELENSFDAEAWTGPCPPEGEPHRYRFTVHALDQPIAGLVGPETAGSPAATVALIEGLALASASLIGTVER